MPTMIRRAVVEDAAALTSVQIESWLTTYRGIVSDAFLAGLGDIIRVERWVERLSAPENFIFVAEERNQGPRPEVKIVGFVDGGPLREPISTYDGELYAIYLLLPSQRKGTGRALTATLAAAMSAQGFTSMLVWVLANNSATHFYEKLGAVRLAEKLIEIGGDTLPEVALGWHSLSTLAASRTTA